MSTAGTTREAERRFSGRPARTYQDRFSGRSRACKMSCLSRLFSSVASCSCSSSDARSRSSSSILASRDSVCWLRRQRASDANLRLASLRRWARSAFDAGGALGVGVASAGVAGVTSVAGVSSECAMSVRTHESSTADSARLRPCWCCIVWVRFENGGIPRIYGVYFFLFFRLKFSCLDCPKWHPVSLLPHFLEWFSPTLVPVLLALVYIFLPCLHIVFVFGCTVFLQRYCSCGVLARFLRSLTNLALSLPDFFLLSPHSPLCVSMSDRVDPGGS